MIKNQPFSIDVNNSFPIRVAALRMAVARQGEMDRLQWWNTKGILTRMGEVAIGRGLPKTHLFARMRIAFAVASTRSEEVFNPPNSYTLWRLPAEIEDQIEDAWSSWLEHQNEWDDFLKQIELAKSNDLLSVLTSTDLVSEKVVSRAKGLRRADDFKSVPLSIDSETAIEAIELLAIAHGSSEPGKLAVPFVREDNFPE